MLQQRDEESRILKAIIIRVNALESSSSSNSSSNSSVVVAEVVVVVIVVVVDATTRRGNSGKVHGDVVNGSEYRSIPRLRGRIVRSLVDELVFSTDDDDDDDDDDERRTVSLQLCIVEYYFTIDRNGLLARRDLE
ncbi:hypothetical protein HZH68_016023 [Vespula germanica]|uniref:Uncharacterized protein n=1 Tax=Vespula germanica TaxID=30212 RepID=A0A834J349_VESGE|nr:hypothetical protein HZH68_016023 [Vespula germanica]